MKILSALMNTLWTISICSTILLGILAALVYNSVEYDQGRPSALEKYKKYIRYTYWSTLGFCVLFGLQVFKWTVSGGKFSALLNMLWTWSILALIISGALWLFTDGSELWSKWILRAVIVFIVLLGVQVFKWSVTEWPSCGCGANKKKIEDTQSKWPQPPYRFDTEPWDEESE